MKRWWLLSNFNLSLVISIFGCLSAIGIQPGLAEEKSGSGQKISPVSTFEIPQLSEIELPAKSATMLAQAPVPSNPSNPDSSSQGEKQGGIATITGVKANPTEKGVEVILETTQGDKLQVTNRSTGNNFIADITGGQLRLPSGDAFTFKSENPISGITQITVTNVDANTVRVTVVGEKTLPTVELFDDNAGLIFAVVNASVATQPPEVAPTQEKPASEAPQEKPFSQQDGPIELVVTGEQDGYRAPNASTATRTDTPIRDIPQSIQVVPQEVLRDRFVEFFYLDRTDSTDVYFGQIDLLSKFKTGSIEHQLLLGFDYEDNSQAFKSFTSPIPPLDLLNPTYNVARPTDLVQDFMYERLTQSYGVYFQDQIAFSNNLKLLIGGRYDWVSNELELVLNDTDEPAVNDGAFSPRVGLVYQPSDTISLYASYSRSFLQTTSFSPGQVFKPTRGTQYEVGIKTDFLEKKLSATLAAYHLTKTNVVTSDPVNPFLSVQTGEQRSQGIELDVAGEILPGWRVIASYAYTDAEVTKDNSISVGNQLNNVPTNQASLWTTYEIQQGNLKGLGFGLGLFYVGERQGDLANTFTLSNYLRTDAALYYRWEGLRAAINIRNLFDTDLLIASCILHTSEKFY